MFIVTENVTLLTEGAGNIEEMSYY